MKVEYSGSGVYILKIAGVSYNITEDKPLYLSRTLKKEARKAIEKSDSLSLDESASRFVDHSVNHAFARVDNGELMFQCDKASNVAGNFNGGGAGNKPILGILGYDGLPVSKFPVIASEAILRTKDTGDDADEDQLGISYNAIIDLHIAGSELVVAVMTKTLGGAVDKYSNTGAAASLTEFDIATDEFYIVGNLPSYTGGLSWFSNPITLDTLLNGDGGDHPTGYPNAHLGTCTADELISTDGGHPAGTKMAAIQAQIGGSGNALKSITAITELTFDGVDMLDS